MDSNDSVYLKENNHVFRTLRAREDLHRPFDCHHIQQIHPPASTLINLSLNIINNLINTNKNSQKFNLKPPNKIKS